jgi:hypothetical protein
MSHQNQKTPSVHGVLLEKLLTQQLVLALQTLRDSCQMATLAELNFK